MAQRYDLGSLRPPERMANGWLRADAMLTRTGVFTYRNADGTEHKELRLDSEVFAPAALASFGLVPLTLDHPPTMLDAQNAKQYSVGAVGENIRRDGDFVRASLLVTDAKAITELEAGKQQVSCGYSCDLVEEPGVHPTFGKYDAVQRNIRGNHVAIVDVGRAGPEARVRLDGDAAEMVDDSIVTKVRALESEFAARHKGKPMAKIKMDGVEFEVTDQVAQAFEKYDATARGVLDAERKARAEADAARVIEKNRADAAEGEVKTLPARADALARLIARAREVLGAEFKSDGLDSRAIKAAMVAKVLGADFKTDGFDEGHLDAALAAAEKLKAEKPSAALAAARVASGTLPDVRVDAANGAACDPAMARKRMMDDMSNAWKNPDKDPAAK